MKNATAPQKRVVFDPNEQPVYLCYSSPTNLAFTHAVLAGIMARDAQNESDTQNFEYLGDSQTRIYLEKESVAQFIHHFRHVVTRKCIRVNAPAGHISDQLQMRSHIGEFNERMRKLAATQEDAA